METSAGPTDKRIEPTQEDQDEPVRRPRDSNKGTRVRKASHTMRRRTAASSGMTASLGESLKDDLGINPPPPLLTVSGGMTQLSDDYLQGLSIDSGGTPNFFHDKSLNDDAHTANMGGVQARGWGSNLGSMLINTRSNGSGRSGGSSGGKSPGYFNNNELSELFSIVRGKPIFGASGTNRRQQPVAFGSATPAKVASKQIAAASPFEQLATLPEHLRALPPIRTKSMESQPTNMPGSSARLFSGLTPHAYVGSGLTPTGMTPGSIAGFPGVDHFGMNLTEGHQGGLVPGMPGWASAAQHAAHKELDNAVVAKTVDERKSVVSKEDIRPAKTAKLTVKKVSEGKGGSRKARGKLSTDQPGDDVDDIPLSGLVQVSSVGSAAAAAAAAAAKLGIALPGAADGANDGEEFENDDEASEKLGSTKSRSRSWLPSEDELVRALVAQHGPRKWTLIASRLKTKTQKQVYARWRDYLQPGLTTKPWSKEEQAKLVELQAHVGNQWAVLARLMPGRSPNAIKNRFHATKRKMERHNKREGSNLGPPGGELKLVEKTFKSTGKPQRRHTSQKSALGEEEYSKEEQMAVEGLLLADTPTSLAAHIEKDAASRQFDIANTTVEDRMREEATKS